MSQRLEVLYNKKPSYNIVIEADFQKLAEELQTLDCSMRKIRGHWYDYLPIVMVAYLVWHRL